MYKSIFVTVFVNYPDMTTVNYYEFDKQGETLLKQKLDYLDGMKLLRKLEREAGKLAKLETNPLTPTVCYKILSFWG